MNNRQENKKNANISAPAPLIPIIIIITLKLNYKDIEQSNKKVKK